MAPTLRTLLLLALPAVLTGCPPSQPRHASAPTCPRLVLSPPDAPTRHLVADAADP